MHLVDVDVIGAQAPQRVLDLARDPCAALRRELQEALPEDLSEELATLAPPIEGVPTESEIRVAQAQLVGWLEGLFHGIQATMMTQQMMAQQQLEQMRRRALPPGQQPEGPGVGPYL